MNEHAAVFGEVERAHVDLVLIEAHSVRVRVEQASQLDQTLIEHGPCLLLADGAVEQREIPNAAVVLELLPNGPDVLRLQWRLGPNDPP